MLRKEPLTAYPLHERPRERLVALGSAALSDAELVAIHLGSGSRGQTALELASRLLLDFGGVEGLGRADVDELARHAGVGLAKACRVVAAFALADRGRHAVERLEVRTSRDIAAVAGPRIGRVRTEQVLLLVLDGAHRVSRVLAVALGGATASTVPIREVLSLALRHDAVAIALAHNHPSGSLKCSVAPTKSMISNDVFPLSGKSRVPRPMICLNSTGEPTGRKSTAYFRSSMSTPVDSSREVVATTGESCSGSEKASSNLVFSLSEPTIRTAHSGS
ncbi:hypothetical protein GCM10009676_09910 [Prauserella halophila]|uniref:DNA repair protein RadC n=1 Tax=Prauserella halophila TaxID=185641 RepID=A0ABP4GTH1_9PSEU